MSSQLSENIDLPTHPDLIVVERGQGAFSSRAVSLRDLPAGALLAKLTGSTQTGKRTYATVQASTNHDIELNSDLVYCNHSCRPSLVFDMSKMEVRVNEQCPLKKGDDLTFFYPSSEWDMAQPFECRCGAGPTSCIGTVRGAKYLEDAILSRYWLNQHIKELLASESRELARN